MQVGMIGLGRMGLNMVRRLLGGAHEVIVWNRSQEPLNEAKKAGALPVVSFQELINRLKPPRIIWLMLPAGQVTEEKIEEISKLVSAGDILIDGGNTYYKDDIRRFETLKKKSIHYLDVGTSGGIWGLEKGYCLMVGGEKKIFDCIEPLLKTLAPENGYRYVGGPGAGHFVKMVHNGIEYGLMQAYGEGFEILKKSPYSFDFAQIAELWNQGSVVRSWLLELAVDAFKRDPELSKISPLVQDSGEGRWTVAQAVESGVPAPAISAALFARFASQDENSFALRLLAALRNEFGAHPIKKAGE